MSRRKRKRARTRAPAARVPVARRDVPPERPKAPWHPFPLVELSVLAGLVLLVLGFLDLESERGRLLLVFGMLLGSLGGLDTALREHFGGFRPHSAVLAGVPAVAVAAALYFAAVPWPVLVLAAAVVFAAGTYALARSYGTRDGDQAAG
jgi:hypothetical protein